MWDKHHNYRQSADKVTLNAARFSFLTFLTLNTRLQSRKGPCGTEAYSLHTLGALGTKPKMYPRQTPSKYATRAQQRS